MPVDNLYFDLPAYTEYMREHTERLAAEDVYKRQEKTSARGIETEKRSNTSGKLERTSFKALPIRETPVSYTHLDVYKRQHPSPLDTS